MISEFAAAKINFFLHVTGRRADHYHLLESLFGFADVGDHLQFAPSDKLELVITGPFAEGLDAGADNLVMKAASALKAAADVQAGAKMILQKNLPLSSGIGGGSADAAACLRGLCRLWDVRLDQKVLLDLALSLGADVPSCLAGQGVFVSGVGEVLHASRLGARWPIVMVNPGFGLSTPAIFKTLQAMDMPFSAPMTPWPPQWGNEKLLQQALCAAHNDLEAPALALQPDVAGVLDWLASLDGAWLSRMSGSGATCFALMNNADEAKHAEALSRDRFPSAWVATGHVEV